jgi:hypothetical protein
MKGVTSQARRWDTRNRSCRTHTALRRRSGLRSFPRLTPTASPGLRLEHRFVQLCIRKKALETCVFLLPFLEAFRLSGLWAPPDCVYIPPYSCCQR